VEPYTQDGVLWVRFTVHPLQRNNTLVLARAARVVDQRDVTSSTGQTERRYVVEVVIELGGETWPIEMTLTDRDQMGFRMLLGRTAVEGRLVVDPDRSFVMGRRRPRKKKSDKKEPRGRSKNAGQRSIEDRGTTP
jgi:hypothetical protein